MLHLLEALGMVNAFLSESTGQLVQPRTIGYCTATERFWGVLPFEDAFVIDEGTNNQLLAAELSAMTDPGGREEKHTLLAFKDENGDTQLEVVRPGHESSQPITHVTLSPRLH